MTEDRRPPGTVHISRYDPEYAVRAERTLADAGFRTQLSDSLREIRHLVGGDRTALIILTGGLAEATTREFLRALEDAAAPVAVLALLERAEADRLDLYQRAGIDELLVKPFDPDELKLVARRLLMREELVGKTRIIGRSEAIKVVLERVAQYAPVHSTVLIEGESGTGKELIARAIHDLSPRSGRPFIPVNCAALTESLLESELFGHEKGAFTGASSLRKGRFEIANRGTLFLDEVGEMPSATQVKLLRVLEEREFMRVGGSAPIQTDVRVIAATNRDLEAAVRAGEFRRDLYYRLNVLHVRMPPLRERREDIPLLIHHFVQEFCRENNRQFVGITDEAMAVLQNYDWPGNVRELRNLVESMLVLTPGSKIRPRDIPEEIYARANPERLLPVALQGETPGGDRDPSRIEALLGYFYRDLKGELDSVRRQMAELRGWLTGGPRELGWLQPVEVEPELPLPPRTPVDDRPRRLAGREIGADTGSRTQRGDPERGDPERGDPERQFPKRDAPEPVPEVETPSEDGIFRVGMSLEELERLAIASTLEAVSGNRRKAARVLGIGERTLYRKLKEYELS